MEQEILMVTVHDYFQMLCSTWAYNSVKMGIGDIAHIKRIVTILCRFYFLTIIWLWSTCANKYPATNKFMRKIRFEQIKFKVLSSKFKTALSECCPFCLAEYYFFAFASIVGRRMINVAVSWDFLWCLLDSRKLSQFCRFFCRIRCKNCKE